MRASITRPVYSVSPWLQLVALFALFAGGGFVGLALASWAAPESHVAAAISGMLLPAAFAAGLIIWSGLDFLLVVLDGRRVKNPGRALVTKTGKWFVPLSVVFSSAGGVVVGILPGGKACCSPRSCMEARARCTGSSPRGSPPAGICLAPTIRM